MYQMKTVYQSDSFQLFSKISESFSCTVVLTDPCYIVLTIVLSDNMCAGNGVGRSENDITMSTVDDCSTRGYHIGKVNVLGD